MDTGVVMDIGVEALVVDSCRGPHSGRRVAHWSSDRVLPATTSIQEMTLSFIPKLAVMVLAIAIFGEWQLGHDRIFQSSFEKVRTLAL